MIIEPLTLEGVEKLYRVAMDTWPDTEALNFFYRNEDNAIACISCPYYLDGVISWVDKSIWKWFNQMDVSHHDFDYWNWTMAYEDMMCCLKRQLDHDLWWTKISQKDKTDAGY